MLISFLHLLVAEIIGDELVASGPSVCIHFGIFCGSMMRDASVKVTYSDRTMKCGDNLQCCDVEIISFYVSP